MDKLTNLIDLWLSATSHLGDDSYAIMKLEIFLLMSFVGTAFAKLMKAMGH